jgi:transcriptional regulator with XRE-family HTH domain
MGSSINLADLGRRIRAARLSRRLTLEEVVARTDFTVSWLSKIENGLLAPSLEGLVRLSEVLECGVDHFVAGLALTPRFAIDRKNGGWRPASGDGRQGVAVEQLATAWQQRAMEPAILHVAGTGKRKVAEHYDGQRFLHVIEGELKLTYGDEPISLAAGDSIYIDASLPHSLAPAAKGSAKVLSVLFEPSRNGHASRAGRPGKARQPPASR